jgi:YD repeat-containing protein
VGQTAYTYDSTYNQVKTITNALNKTWTFTLDSQQKSPIAVTDPLGHTTNAAYNAQGQITSITDPLHNPATTFGYASPSDDLASVADPMGNVTSFVTDNVGRVTSATSPLRETSSYIYDDRNDLVQATDPMGLQTSYTYNLEGLITSVTDSNNNKTTFDWTPPLTTNEWNLQVCNPVHACDQYLIANISGALDDHFDKNGLETKYTYDNRGRRIKTQYDYNSVSGYNPWTSHYSWDGERLTEVKSYNGSTLDDDLTMTYDTLG